MKEQLLTRQTASPVLQIMLVFSAGKLLIAPPSFVILAASPSKYRWKTHL